MMHRKTVATVAALALATVGVAPALAAHKSAAATKLTISTPVSQSYKINRYAQFGLRWNKDTYTIKSGGTLAFKNLESDEPHTFSVLKASQMPRTKKALEACGTEGPTAAPKYPPCRAIFKAHAPDAQGNPQNPVVNVGKAGIDRPGDSLFIAPKGAGPQQTIKVTAKKGTTLHFICLVHPWMQATLLVR
jgi:hypothetical protein